MFVTSSQVDVECAVVDGHVGVESTSDATSSREESSPFIPFAPFIAPHFQTLRRFLSGMFFSKAISIPVCKNDFEIVLQKNDFEIVLQKNDFENDFAVYPDILCSYRHLSLKLSFCFSLLIISLKFCFSFAGSQFVEIYLSFILIHERVFGCFRD